MANHTTESRNKAQDAAGKAQDAAGKALEAGQAAVAGVADKARDMSSDAMRAGQHAAQQAAHSVGNAAQQAAHSVGNAAENATSRVGEGMQNLAQTVRQRGPDAGVLGSAADTVADTLEQGGRYIQSEGLSGMTDDLTTLIKRNPIPALLVGVGFGFLLARLTSRS